MQKLQLLKQVMRLVIFLSMHLENYIVLYGTVMYSTVQYSTVGPQ